MKRIFEWDPVKESNNIRKHGVDFMAAARAFDDPMAVTGQDRTVDGEERWQLLGISTGQNLLLVAHTFRDRLHGVEQVRIISARKANKTEWRKYGPGEL